MASESVSVSGPVDVITDSKQRVALDLMRHIDMYSPLKSDQKPKEYWLKLYSQCNGLPIESILKED